MKTPICVSVGVDWLKKVDRYIKKHGITRSALIQSAVNEKLAKEK